MLNPENELRENLNNIFKYINLAKNDNEIKEGNKVITMAYYKKLNKCIFTKIS